MTPQQFIAKWQRANLSERSAAQQHFLDLLDQATDVWMRESFAWEHN